MAEFQTEEKCINRFKVLIANKKNIAEHQYYESVSEQIVTRNSISEAIKKGYVQAIRLCVPYSVRPNTIFNKTTLLIEAIRNKNIDIVKYLVDCGANVCQENSGKESPLSVAVATEKLEIIEMLLNHGAKLNLQTAFIDAICFQNQSIVKCFIESGVFVNFRYKVIAADTPLQESINAGNPEIVELLIKNGADPNLSGLNDQLSLLSSIERDPRIAKILVENGAEVNRCDSRGKIPLIEAILSQDFKLVKCMVEKGADINVTTDNQCALSVAAQLFNMPIFEFLIKSGANEELTKEEMAQINDDFRAYLEGIKIKSSMISGSGHESLE